MMQIPDLPGGKCGRVVVTRDHRVRRPQDILASDEYVQFKAGHLG
jgi:hypothetical protein